ncbi:MAG: PqqD family protein [Oscillospiraceae bacterium]|nr:PqqD family protein [Oscillospiraceae bacterium]
MKLKLDFVLREIAGETLLVPAGKAALDLNGMITLNAMGTALWNKLPEVENEAALVQWVLDEYEVDADTARADVSAFLGRLRQLGIV